MPSMSAACSGSLSRRVGRPSGGQPVRCGELPVVEVSAPAFPVDRRAQRRRPRASGGLLQQPGGLLGAPGQPGRDPGPQQPVPAQRVVAGQLGGPVQGHRGRAVGADPAGLGGRERPARRRPPGPGRPRRPPGARPGPSAARAEPPMASAQARCPARITGGGTSASTADRISGCTRRGSPVRKATSEASSRRSNAVGVQAEPLGRPPHQRRSARRCPGPAGPGPSGRRRRGCGSPGSPRMTSVPPLPARAAPSSPFTRAISRARPGIMPSPYVATWTAQSSLSANFRARPAAMTGG